MSSDNERFTDKHRELYPWRMEYAYNVGREGFETTWHYLDSHETCMSAKIVMLSGTMHDWARNVARNEDQHRKDGDHQHTTVTVRIVDRRHPDNLDNIVACAAWYRGGVHEFTYVEPNYHHVWSVACATSPATSPSNWPSTCTTTTSWSPTGSTSFAKG